MNFSQIINLFSFPVKKYYTTYHLCNLPGHTHHIPLKFSNCYEDGCWTWESLHV